MDGVLDAHQWRCGMRWPRWTAGNPQVASAGMRPTAGENKRMYEGQNILSIYGTPASHSKSYIITLLNSEE